MKPTLLMGAMLAGMIVHNACASQIWFAAVDPISQPRNPATNHFMDLFQPGAHWNDATKKIQVLKISTQFLHTAPEEYLAAVVHDAKRRNLSIAMEGFLLTASLRCGNGGVESYASPGTIRDIIERLTRLGGTLSYVAMDEPIHFGHYAEGPAFCHDPVEALAAQMAPNVQALKAAFPSIKFGDIEPLNQYTVGRIDTMLTFAREFRLATGEPISFIHADIGWGGDNWRPQLVEWEMKADAADIGLGVIIDGDNQDKNDLAWAAKAVQRYGAVMRGLPRPPDQIIFQSWMAHPSTTVPDDQPGTLSSIVINALGL
jgi:hypothetical protein